MGGGGLPDGGLPDDDGGGPDDAIVVLARVESSGLESVVLCLVVVVVVGVADGFIIYETKTTADGHVLFGLCITARCLSAQRDLVIAKKEFCRKTVE